MAVFITQVTVPTTGAVKLCDVPPATTVVLSSNETSIDVYLGTNSAVTATTGAPLDDGGPTTITNPPAGAPFPLWAISGTGSHAVGVVAIPAR